MLVVLASGRSFDPILLTLLLLLLMIVTLAALLLMMIEVLAVLLALVALVVVLTLVKINSGSGGGMVTTNMRTSFVNVGPRVSHESIVGLACPFEMSIMKCTRLGLN